MLLILTIGTTEGSTDCVGIVRIVNLSQQKPLIWRKVAATKTPPTPLCIR